GFFIITTLLDPIKYPSEEIAELYLKRWDVELFFRDIKTTMGMGCIRRLWNHLTRRILFSRETLFSCALFSY
ncbi:transposase, partial [Desulfogranum marinum]|uniref:transposase n=1 Tax=Desulfogranum marinum TaxID=453220 RepID=UPI0019641AE6